MKVGKLKTDVSSLPTETLRVGRVSRLGYFHIIRNDGGNDHHIGFCGQHIKFNVADMDSVIARSDSSTLCVSCIYYARKKQQELESLSLGESIAKALNIPDSSSSITSTN